MADTGAILNAEKLLYPGLDTESHRSLLYDDLHPIPVTQPPPSHTTRVLLAESIDRYCQHLHDQVVRAQLPGEWTDNGTLLISTTWRDARDDMWETVKPMEAVLYTALVQPLEVVSFNTLFERA